MTAIAELRKMAAEKFEGYSVDFGSDTLVLKNMLNLDDKEMSKFTEYQKSLTERDEEDDTDVEAFKNEFVECLVTVAEDKRKARKLLSSESIAVLMVILEEYGASVSEATKSDSAD